MGNGTKFQIGNDVVLTILSLQLPLSIDSIEMNNPVDYITLRGTGDPEGDYMVQSSTDLITWTDLWYASNNNGSLSYQASWNKSKPKCFYRFIQPAPGN